MKSERLFYVLFETAAGWIGLLGSSQGLLKTTFPQQSREAAGLLLGETVSQAEHSITHFHGAVDELNKYFDGQVTNFSLSLDLSQATDFCRSVWEATRGIPYGKTESYSGIARQIGKPSAPRAVGQALGRNPLPIIIPCHRVLTSDNRLGGFGGGLEMKRSLLELEGTNKSHWQ